MKERLNRRSQRLVDHMVGKIKEIQVEKVFKLPCGKPHHIINTAPFARCVKMLKPLQGVNTDRSEIVKIRIGQVNSRSP